jgi:hypothetical protein
MSQPIRFQARPSLLVFLAAMVAVIALGVTLGRRPPAPVPGAAAPAAVGLRGSAPATPTLPNVVADPRPSRRAADEWQGMPIEPEATALCDAVDACGLAMACIDGRCGACAADDSCAPGEICALDHCVRAELASCRSRTDCGANALCILGGTTADPRGNAVMTARCLPAAGGTPDDAPAVVAGEAALSVPVPAADLLEQVERDVRDR